MNDTNHSPIKDQISIVLPCTIRMNMAEHPNGDITDMYTYFMLRDSSEEM